MVKGCFVLVLVLSLVLSLPFPLVFHYPPFFFPFLPSISATQISIEILSCLGGFTVCYYFTLSCIVQRFGFWRGTGGA